MQVDAARAPRRPGRRRLRQTRPALFQAPAAARSWRTGLDYLTEITHRRPRAWVEEVEQLFELLQSHGPEPIRSAFARAMAAHTIGIEYVRRYVGVVGSRGGGPPKSPPQRLPKPALGQQELPL